MKQISVLEMTKASPFDPILTKVRLEIIELQDGKGDYYRIHTSRHLRDIVREDTGGFSFLQRLLLEIRTQ